MTSGEEQRRGAEERSRLEWGRRCPAERSRGEEGETTRSGYRRFGKEGRNETYRVMLGHL